MNLTPKKESITSKRSFGTWLSIPSTMTTEIITQSPDINWLVIDMEHTSISNQTAYQMIQVIDLAGKTPLVRVGKNDPLLIKQALDAGAYGVIVPMVNTKEDAQNAVDSVYYPNKGKRGVGLWRAQNYGSSFADYKNWAEKELITIVQIEHIDAVNNLEEILSIQGLDGIMIGPYDLSGSLKTLGKFDSKEMLEALDKVAKLTKSVNKILGYHMVHPNPQELERLQASGYNFIALGVDMIFLSDGLKSQTSFIKSTL